MGEGADALHGTGHALKETGEEFGMVLAEYGAPVLGLVVGYSLGTVVGGAWTVANFANGVMNPSNDPSKWATSNLIGGLAFGGIMLCAGAGVWSISSGTKSKTAGHIVTTAIVRFASGMLIGWGLNAIVNGLTDNIKQGSLDTAVSNFEGTVSQKAGSA